ncbi:DoxX family protein [Intrasporangium sp.]|uniref:DoxX family protein n=1 Tax=Intrasporangium sp. TaxID=1925024 RepID=UPI00293B59CB|nr:DoxX family protein [Intrasporangium sp.]MDV3222802.1 DoxX family protein [Intrasporangium sp.]
MDVAFLIGRLLFAFLFLGSGFAHLTKTADMAAYAGARGVPSPKLATQASGALIIVGALMVLLGVWGDLGSLLLLVFLLPTAVLMHAFWKETEPMAKQTEMVQFNKDLALAGATLAFFWVFAQDPGLTITTSLF